MILKAKFLVIMAVSFAVCNIASVAAEDYSDFSIKSSITRLQVRHATDGEDIVSLTFSSFLQAENELFFLGILDYQTDLKQANPNGRIELNVGGPVSNTPLGWLIRGRSYYDEKSAAAVGVQLNFNEIPRLNDVLRDSQIHTFLQFLQNAEDPYFSRNEVLHYYSVNIVPKTVALRGYNVFSSGGEHRSVRNHWADLIYSLNNDYDIYYRIDYVSEDNAYLGAHGSVHYVGFRLNWY